MQSRIGASLQSSGGKAAWAEIAASTPLSTRKTTQTVAYPPK